MRCPRCGSDTTALVAVLSPTGPTDTPARFRCGRCNHTWHDLEAGAAPMVAIPPHVRAAALDAGLRVADAAFSVTTGEIVEAVLAAVAARLVDAGGTLMRWADS